jgi:hypothetical protein
MLRAPSVSQPSKAEYALEIAVPVHSIWKVENLWERPAERWLNATVTVIPILCGPRLFLICASKKKPPSAGPAGSDIVAASVGVDRRQRRSQHGCGVTAHRGWKRSSPFVR